MNKRFFLIVVVYAAAFYLVLGANVFEKQTVAPVSLLGNYEGWSEHEFSSPETHPERSDVLDFFIPQWIVAKENILEGYSGFWNPVTQNGAPGLLDVSRGLWTPSFLAFLLVPQDWLGFYLAGFLKLLIAGLGMFLLARNFVSFLPAFASGFVFALCGFNAAWFYWPQVATSAWIPWLLWGVTGWYFYRRYLYLAYMSIVTALLIGGGFPAVSAYGLYSAVILAAILSLYRNISFRDSLIHAGLASLSIVTGFLMMAVPILGLADLLQFSDLSYRTGETTLKFLDDIELFYDRTPEPLHRVEKSLYIGGVAILFALSAAGLLLIKRLTGHRAVFAWVGLVLFAISLSISFGLLPAYLINAIPAVGGSPWSRVSIIVLLSITILFAVGLDVVFRNVRSIRDPRFRILLTLSLVCVLVYQLWGQLFVFRSFNTVASAADFFPDTPLTEFIGSNLENTQSVLADKSFIVNGTLGAYGINEWLAHGFRSKQEKEIFSLLIDDPFATPTAAQYSFSDLSFIDDLYSKLGIRYILYSENDYVTRRSVAIEDHSPLPPMSSNTLAQIISIESGAYVEGMAFLFGTYGRNSSPGPVTLSISKLGGGKVVEITRAAETIRDNHWGGFRFDGQICFEPGRYVVNLSLQNGDGPLTVWFTEESVFAGDRVCINDECDEGSMIYQLFVSGGNAELSSPWKVREKPFGGIRVAENANAPRGSYFVPKLSFESEWSVVDVSTKRSAPSRIMVEYSGNRSGYIVVPMRYYPGWKAYSGGSEVEVHKYLGVMPAAKVEGASSVTFVFEPSWLKYGVILTSFGFMLLLVFMALHSRERSSER